MMDAWQIWLLAGLAAALIGAGLHLAWRSYMARGRAWTAHVRMADWRRVRRVRAAQAAGKAPPSVTLQVDKARHYLQTPGGRRRTKHG